MSSRVEYKIKVSDPPDSEDLAIRVRLSVVRLLLDENGMTLKAEKVRDPETFRAWTHARAVTRAIERGRQIVHEDERARGVRPTARFEYRS